MSLLICLVLSANLYAVSADSVKVIQNKPIEDTTKIDLLIDYVQRITSRDQNTSEALRALETAEEIAYQSDNIAHVTQICQERGYIYQNLGNSDQAYDCYKRGYDISVKLQDTSLMMETAFKLGYLMNGTEQHEKELFYWKIIQKLNTKEEQIPIIEMLLGSCYYSLNKFDLSEKLLVRSHEEFLRKEHPWLPYSTVSLSDLYAAQGKNAKAIKTLETTYDLIRDKSGIAQLSLLELALGKALNKQERYAEAREYLLRSKEGIYTVYHNPNKLEFNYQLYLAEKNLNNSTLALNYLERAYNLNDTLYRVGAQEKLIEMTEKYQAEKKELELIKQKKIAKEASIKRRESERVRQWQFILFSIISVLILLLAVLAYRRWRAAKKSKEIIEQQKQDVESAYSQLNEKNQEVMDSITYAKRIQTAILPSEATLNDYLGKHFIYYSPKDIVAGDFYWTMNIGDSVFFAVCDCTGHGVPGAMVSMMCHNALNRSVKEFGLTDTGSILDKTRETLQRDLDAQKNAVSDGMDIGLCKITGDELQFSGAYIPLWLISEGELTEIKGNKQPIGKFDHSTPFDTHVVSLKKGDTIYLSSDGFPDQFGGEKNKKYKSVNFKRFLQQIHHSGINEQHHQLADEFNSWKGENEQLDDVCVLGYVHD